MTWNLTQATDTGCVYVDSVNPNLKRLCTGPRMNMDGLSIDYDLQRVNNAQLNGWGIQTKAPWHFTIQGFDEVQSQDDIGTIGFGGRKGQHRLKFRLANIGYIHGPTRDITDILGPADYQRTNLTSTIQQRTLPDGIRNVAQHINWANIFSTPGGGEVFIKWKVSAGKLKEDVTINQAAREWIVANQPPTTPANETYFGLRFIIDASDVPKWVKNGITQTGDFDDSDHPIEMKNALDELLGFMPIDTLYVPSKGGARTLLKRIWPGNMFVGVKISDLASLLPGDLVFDPSLTTEAIQADSDDVFVEEKNSNFYEHYAGNFHFGEYYSQPETCGFRFTTIAIPNVTDSPALDEVTAATLTIEVINFNQNGASADIFGDEASGNTWATGDRPTLANITETAASTLWSFNSTGTVVSPNFAAVVDETIKSRSGGWSNGDDIRFSAEGNSGVYAGSYEYARGYDRNSGTGDVALLDVTWTEIGGGIEALRRRIDGD